MSRFSVVFAAPSVDARRATLVIPFVEVNDLRPSVKADLRDVPLDLALGGHRFRVLNAESPGGAERRISLEILPSSASPRFMQPARVAGVGAGGFSWGPQEAGRPLLMSTAVGDPPIVTFTGAVLRIEGPWRVELPLT